MDKLISQQAAIDALRTCYDTETVTMDYGDEYINYEDAVGEIEKLPSIQPDIIRCKDCKYWTHIKRTNRYWCKTDDGLFDLNPSPDDFCSRAERREDGQTD